MEALLPLTIKIMLDRRSKDAPYVAYTPELDVASCGPTEEKARRSLREAVAIVLEEIKKKGKLNEFLEEMGFQKEKRRWIPPSVTFEPFFIPSPN